jgi:predicted nucleotidyltransferase
MTCRLKENKHIYIIISLYIINKLCSTQQYLGEHYGVQSLTLFGSLAKGKLPLL